MRGRETEAILGSDIVEGIIKALAAMARVAMTLRD